MKSILTISLLLNLVLGVGVGAIIKQRHATIAANASPAPAPASNEPAARKPSASTNGAAQSAKGPASDDSDALMWKKVESTDYKEYIANLRAIGCPEKTIRDIIKADVKKLYSQKMKAVYGIKEKQPYWKPVNPMQMADPEKMKAANEVVKERQNLLKELLGEGSLTLKDMMGGFEDVVNPMANQLDFLSDEKQGQISQLQMKLQAKLMKLMKNGGAMDQEDMKEYQKLQKDTEKQIQSLLTPAEWEQYELRMSNTANQLRFSMVDFEPSEQEYLTIFKSKKGFDEKWNGVDWSDPETNARLTKERMEEEKRINDTLKAQLGEQRFAEYQRGSDWAYRSISDIVKQNNLPKESGYKVYDMKKATEESFQKLQQDASLSHEQRQQAMQGMFNDMESSMKGVLGDKGWDSLKKNNQAWWINNLKAQAGVK